eukprot:5378704-Pleurochrysis_carterae.AAC.1
MEARDRLALFSACSKARAFYSKVAEEEKKVAEASVNSDVSYDTPRCDLDAEQEELLPADTMSPKIHHVLEPETQASVNVGGFVRPGLDLVGRGGRGGRGGR